MADFTASFLLLMDLEGGNRPDGGFISNDNNRGQAKFGITQRTLDDYHTAYRKRNDGIVQVPDLVRSLTIDHAKFITKVMFWDEMKLDLIQSQPLANQILAHAFNFGPRTAACMVQSAAGVTIDGAIGSITIAALNNGWIVQSTMRTLLTLCRRRYEWLAVSNPALYGDDLVGWRNRLVKLSSPAVMETVWPVSALTSLGWTAKRK